MRRLPQPLVIDADGVNCLGRDPDCLKEAAGPRLITPHPGEMARFLGTTTADIQARRLEVAREVAARYGIYGNPALASGGTGDVLTGLIGGYLAQGLPPWDAARLGVYLHGLAADFLVEHTGIPCLIAGDLMTIFPELLAEFAAGRFPQTEEGICYKRVRS
ncbi:MAG: NAD(P)H-hydrate dehydratase [Deltaproteobacteria bacterium]|nr:NAD(P)H-hydrate dehydratase [Deltaproteobacteria bacterium]